MPSNTKNIARDAAGIPAPQYFNGQSDKYEPVEGRNGATFVEPISAGSHKSAVQDVATAGTKVQLPAYACHEITLIAKKGNTGSIYVGGNNVSSTVYGVELKANESFTFVVNNASLIYIDASVSGEGISYVAV